MKILVVMETGEQRCIELDEVVQVNEGRVLNRLTNGRVEHFFTKDGHYDGWGEYVFVAHRASPSAGHP